MNLREYDGKVVVIVTDSDVYWGTVWDYFFPEDNVDGEESILLRTYNDEFIEFNNGNIVFNL